MGENSRPKDQEFFWRIDPLVWIFVSLVIIALMYFAYQDVLYRMYLNWIQREEYSHGIMIPFISLFLIWQEKDHLQRLPLTGAWWGVALMGLAFIFFVLGEISAISVLHQISFLIILAGIGFILFGQLGMKKIWPAFLFLLFMIPLPAIIFQELSTSLQLLSSKLGVWVIRIFGISVFLEGNVIDLGSYKLQVVEACNGLRYLFPLMSLTFIICYFYNDRLWKKVLIFLSSIPITVILNSIRIGIIGITVEYWGTTMAEGILHDFEGWVIFMICTAIIMLEILVFARLSGDHRHFNVIMGFVFPPPTPKSIQRHSRGFSIHLIGATIISTAIIATSTVLEERLEEVPKRDTLSSFPLDLDGWEGHLNTMEQIYISALQFDDYLLANYVDKGDRHASLYVAWYDSQKKGASIHSPRACIPGGGWVIRDLSQLKLSNLNSAGHTLWVNRVVIKKGNSSQLVYYWFQQRGRIITNEYMLKWYLFLDSLTKNRSDGALIRVTTNVNQFEKLSDGDKRLEEFIEKIIPHLNKHIPD